GLGKCHFVQLVSTMLWKDPKKDRAVPKNAGALHVLSIELDDRTDNDDEKGELEHQKTMRHLDHSYSYLMWSCVRIRRPGSRRFGHVELSRMGPKCHRAGRGAGLGS